MEARPRKTTTNPAAAKNWRSAMFRAADLLEEAEVELRDARMRFVQADCGGPLLDAMCAAEDAMGCIRGARLLAIAAAEDVKKAATPRKHGDGREGRNGR